MPLLFGRVQNPQKTKKTPAHYVWVMCGGTCLLNRNFRAYAISLIAACGGLNVWGAIHYRRKEHSQAIDLCSM